MYWVINKCVYVNRGIFLVGFKVLVNIYGYLNFKSGMYY